MKEKELEYYREYAHGLEKIEEFIKTHLLKITEYIKKTTGDMPVEHIRSRIKSADSMKEKLWKKNQSTDVTKALTVVSDLIGFRIVTHFVGEVYAILERIKSYPLWRVDKIKDYISDPKPNGYRSLHVIIEISLKDLQVELPGIERLKVEIQMRTIAMDSWAALEHEMKYKRNIDNGDLIVEELKRCADEMASTDLSMQTIRDMIRKGNNRK